jgi:tRNA splicing ligase
MFTPEDFINQVVKAKKQFVATFVKNEAAATAMNEFVDTQATYTKEAVKAFTKVGTSLVSETVTASQKFVNQDFSKYFKAYKA